VLESGVTTRRRRSAPFIPSAASGWSFRTGLLLQTEHSIGSAAIPLIHLPPNSI
jgi:hypothetical protein